MHRAWCGYAEKMLKVVKEHIGEVAEVCPECKGSNGGIFPKIKGQVSIDIAKCNRCNGLGVIARTEGDV
jgi:hypothetical protein